MLRYRTAIVSENGFLAFPNVDAQSKWVAHLNNMLIPVSDYGIGVTNTWCRGSCDQSLFRWLYAYHCDKAVSSEMPAITSFLQVYDANSISCDREWIFLHSRFISFALWFSPCAFSRSPICRPVADRRRDNDINPILTRVGTTNSPDQFYQTTQLFPIWQSFRKISKSSISSSTNKHRTQ